MKFSYLSSLIFVVALFLFAQNDVEAAITSVLSEIAEVEKVVAGKEYQDIQEAIIMASLDKDSKAAKATIQAIRKAASQLKPYQDSVQNVTNLVIDSILSAVRIMSTAERLANNAFEVAKNLTDYQDPKGATESVKKSMKHIADFVFTCGVPIEDLFGSALALAGGANHQELKQGMSFMQCSGTAMLEALKIAEQIAIMGIEAGGSAAEDGFKAACEAVATGGSAAFAYLYKGAKNILDGYTKSVLNNNIINNNRGVSGIIDSLTSEVSIDDEDALTAIDDLNNNLDSMLSMSTVPQSGKDAAKILIRALTSTILETADAIVVAKKALEEAAKLANNDVEAAVTAVQKGMQAARDEVVHGSSTGFLGFGAARQIADGVVIERLISPMVELIIGRVEVYNDLKLAQETALMGIRSGAIDQGINAAIQICKAAGNALYVQFVESGNIGLSVFANTGGKDLI